MNASAVSRIRHWIAERPGAVSVALTLACLPLKLHGYALGYLNIHAARDWERGWRMLRGQEMVWHGPELLFGGAVPGFFFNLLTGLFQIPHRNPFFAAMGPAILFCLSVGFFHDAARRFFRPSVALMAAAVYAVFPLGTLAIRYYWNPSYLFLFTTLTFWCVARALDERRPNFLAGALMSALLASQIHLSGYALVAAVPGMMWLIRRRPAWSRLGLVVAVHLAFVAPFFVSEYNKGWPAKNQRLYRDMTSDVRILRLAPTHNFLRGVGAQMLVKSPGWEQSAPFSYYHRFYRESGRLVRGVGWMAWGLSFGTLALFLGGAGVALTTRRSPARAPRKDEASLPGADDPPPGATRRDDERNCADASALDDGSPPDAETRFRDGAAFARCCLLVFALVCLPVLLWNPAIGPEGRTDQPLRYYFIFWPGQFFVAALGMEALLRGARRRARATTPPGTRGPALATTTTPPPGTRGSALATTTTPPGTRGSALATTTPPPGTRGSALATDTLCQRGLVVWVAAYVAVCLVFAVLFTNFASRTGKPFRYLFFDHWTVNALRDKMAIAEHLRRDHGIDESLFLRRVHTDGHLFKIPEESLDYEIRAAIENHPDAPEPDPSLYYYIFEFANAEHLRGDFREVDLRRFGSLGVLVYRPIRPLGDMQLDPPVSWWWY